MPHVVYSQYKKNNNRCKVVGFFMYFTLFLFLAFNKYLESLLYTLIEILEYSHKQTKIPDRLKLPFKKRNQKNSKVGPE